MRTRSFFGKVTRVSENRGSSVHRVHGEASSGLDTTVRPVRPKDFDDVSRIVQEAYLNAGYFASSDHPYMRWLAQVEERAQHALVWIAEQKLGGASIPVGTVTLARYGSQYAELAKPGELEMRAFAVDPAIRRTGVGREIMAAIQAYAKQQDGLEALVLASGDHWLGAKTFYLAQGFVAESSRDWSIEVEEGTVWLRVFRRTL